MIYVYSENIFQKLFQFFITNLNFRAWYRLLYDSGDFGAGNNMWRWVKKIFQNISSLVSLPMRLYWPYQKCSTELNIYDFIFDSYHSHYYCFCYLLVREVLEFTKYRVDFLYWYWFLWFSSKLLVGLETRINTRASDKVSRNSFIAEQMQGWSSDHQKQRVTLETFNQSDKIFYSFLNWYYWYDIIN